MTLLQRYQKQGRTLLMTFFLLTLSVLLNIALYGLYLNKVVDYADCMASLTEEVTNNFNKGV